MTLHSSRISMTTPGPMSPDTGIWSTVLLSRPVAQWAGASRWVPVCSPVSKEFQYQKGPRSSYRDIPFNVNPGVWPHWGGSSMTGVLAFRGWVRSMTLTPPLCMPWNRDASTSLIASTSVP